MYSVQRLHSPLNICDDNRRGSITVILHVSFYLLNLNLDSTRHEKKNFNFELLWTYEELMFTGNLDCCKMFNNGVRFTVAGRVNFPMHQQMLFYRFAHLFMGYRNTFTSNWNSKRCFKVIHKACIEQISYLENTLSTPMSFIILQHKFYIKQMWHSFSLSKYLYR